MDSGQSVGMGAWAERRNRVTKDPTVDSGDWNAAVYSCERHALSTAPGAQMVVSAVVRGEGVMLLSLES